MAIAYLDIVLLMNKYESEVFHNDNQSSLDFNTMAMHGEMVTANIYQELCKINDRPTDSK